jgi:hypothetical protein
MKAVKVSDPEQISQFLCFCILFSLIERYHIIFPVSLRNFSV